MTYKNGFFNGAVIEYFGQAEQRFIVKIVGPSRLRQGIGSAVAPAVIDERRAACLCADSLRKVAPLGDAAKSLMKKYKHRQIFSICLRLDKFDAHAVLRRVDAEPFSRDGQYDLPPAFPRKIVRTRKQLANTQDRNGGVHRHYRIILYFTDDCVIV